MRFVLGKRITKLFGLTPAVLSLLGNRSTSLVSGAVSSLLIIVFLNPEIQGYHYTFLTLIAMANLAEFGFAGATQQFAAHEWAYLSLSSEKTADGESVPLDRLSSIVKFTFLWAGGGAVFLIVALFVVGYAMFSTRSGDVVWLVPWLILVVAAGIDFGGNLLLAMLEGCDQVAEVNLIRIVRLIAYSIVMWSVVALGGGLWAAPMGMAAAVAMVTVAIVIRWRKFLWQLSRRTAQTGIRLRQEFLPLQARFGVSSVANYMAYSLLVPIAFAMDGPVKAGQFGLTWLAVEAIVTISGSWFVANVPQYGAYVARSERSALDRLAVNSTSKSLATIVALGLAFLLVIWILSIHFDSLSERLLPLVPTAALVFGGVFRVVNWSVSVYVRSHKREPFLFLQLLSGPVLLAVFTIATRLHGVDSAVVWYTAASVVGVTPILLLIFVRFYREQSKRS